MLEDRGSLMQASLGYCMITHAMATDYGLFCGAQPAGQGLGSGELAVPVLLYGRAHSAGRTLADIRRACGYFKGAHLGRI